MRDLERARSALQYLDPSDRPLWVKMAFAMRTEFDDSGYDTWADWSEGHKRPQQEISATWRSARAKAGGTTINTLFYLAKQEGWKDDAGYKPPSAAELAERKKRADERAARDAEIEAQMHSDAAASATKMWDAAQQAVEHPYLTKKGVKPHGLRVGTWEVIDGTTGEVITIKGCLLIPMRDRQRNLWSLQAIEPGGRKRYLKGGAKQGRFHIIGGKPLQAAGKPVFVLVEGYATGASVHEATGHLVLVCFDSSNLAAVAQQLRERNADATILIAGDNDLWNRKEDGTPTNPGMIAAGKAAEAVGGLTVYPPFTEGDATGKNDKGQATGPTDWNDWADKHGLESVAQHISAALQPPPSDDDGAPWEGESEINESPPAEADEPEAPAPQLPVDPGEGEHLESHAYFTVLGYDGDDYYFFDHRRRQVSKRTRSNWDDFSMAELADTQWWEEHFPAPGRKGGINRVQAFEWFAALARARGIYDPRNIRGRGAWRDNGRVVFHHGDYLTVGDKSMDVADIQSKWVYPVSRPMPPLNANPLTDAEGAHLLKLAGMARWTRQGSAALLAGWVFLSPVCGALPWRPHVWLTGAAGSGKSTLQSQYVQPMLNGISEFFQGDSTEAGIRQNLRADAVPALIDEFEPNDENDRKRMKAVLTMIRQASSESDAQTVKGTLSGDGVRFHIRSMFCLASVNTMLDKDSDKSRITMLALKPPAKSGSKDDQWATLEEELHKLGKDSTVPARMLARALVLLPTILANVEVFCRVAADRFGTQRQGDQFGTMLAGAWCLTHQSVATDAEAMALINSYDWSEHQEAGETMTDSEKALASVLGAKIKIGGGLEVTVHELIGEAAEVSETSAKIGKNVAVDILQRNGMRLDGQHLVFWCQSDALRSLVAGTPYETDLRGQLLRLPGSTTFRLESGNQRTFRFLGAPRKAIGIPLASVVGDEEPPI